MRWGGRAALGGLALLVVSAASCDGGSVARLDAAAGDGPAGSETTSAPALLDLVFVIDNTGGMEIPQRVLGESFPRLLEQLEKLPRRPDLRIAFLSSDFGAGPAALGDECPVTGDKGLFQVAPECGFTPQPATSRWLTVDADGRGNFPGDLSTTVSCLTRLGSLGCAYEHHLQSLRMALDARATPENAGFLRPEADLGIIILANEDDCSADPASKLFGYEIPGQGLSFRCAMAGHTCNGEPVPAMNGWSAPLSSCQPTEHADTQADRDTRLINVSSFVRDIKALKPGRPDRIFVSVIIGWDDSPGATYSTALSHDVGPALNVKYVCITGLGWGQPGVRLRHFARSFSRHTVHSICADDYNPLLTEIGAGLAGMMTAPR